jgi:hypothetical protein
MLARTVASRHQLAFLVSLLQAKAVVVAAAELAAVADRQVRLASVGKPEQET